MRFADQDDAAAARGDFLHVGDRLLEHRVARREHDDRHRLVDQRDRPVLQFARRVALGVDVGELLQLQRAFERERIGGAAAEIEHVAGARELVRDLLELRLELQRLGEQAGRRDQFADQLALLGLARSRRGRGRGSIASAGHRGELAGEGLGRGDADLRAGQRRRAGVGEPRDAGGRHIDDRERLRRPAPWRSASRRACRRSRPIAK